MTDKEPTIFSWKNRTILNKLNSVVMGLANTKAINELSGNMILRINFFFYILSMRDVKTTKWIIIKEDGCVN